MKSIAALKTEGKLTDERHQELVALLPARYKDVNLDDCPAPFKDWAYGPHDSRKGLYLYGPVGTGKTHCAYALWLTLKANGINTRIINSARMLQDIKDDFKYSSRDPYYHSKFDGWVDFSGILIIDDIGAEKPTDWVLETFYTLINTRYEEERITIFTSNFTLEEIAGRLGDRIASRVAEMCDVIKLDGDDRRLTTNQ